MVQVRDQGRPAADTEQVAESAGILMRVSSDGQDELNQLPELEDYCYDQNYRINRRYELHDKSAFHGEHEETLAAILEDIRAGVITVVVIVHAQGLTGATPPSRSTTNCPSGQPAGGSSPCASQRSARPTWWAG